MMKFEDEGTLRIAGVEEPTRVAYVLHISPPAAGRLGEAYGEMRGDIAALRRAFEAGKGVSLVAFGADEGMKVGLTSLRVEGAIGVADFRVSGVPKGLVDDSGQ